MFLLFLVSCQKSIETEGVSSNGNKFKGKLGTISPDVATNIAKNFIKMYYGKQENREIEEQETVAEKGDTLFYIFNYKNGGFLVLSAENGEMPILATGLESKFPLKGDINPGVGMWLTETRDRIGALRTGKTPPRAHAAKMWDDLKNHTYKSAFQIVSPRDLNNVNLRYVSPIGPDCSTLPIITTQIGPLMSTEWGQGCGFNAQTPTFPTGSCGHAPTGCVATATAQVMKYHNFPLGIGLNNMPLSGSNGFTATLMHNIGISINMNYTATSSGANTANVETFLEVNGYSTEAKYAAYNSATVQLNIDQGRPVILDGCNNQSCFMMWCWATGPDCHAWVCDGYRKTVDPCYATFILYHMNWGWSSSQDGYYYSPNPLLYNFQYGREMLYNIHPSID